MAEAGISVNIVLMVLNLQTILPLDGGRVVANLLPDRVAAGHSRLEPYGFPILLALIHDECAGNHIESDGSRLNCDD